jgi:hypothetical protein
MMEYLDIALDYLKTHKLIAAAIAVLFFALLIKNVWFLVKLIVVLAIGAVVVFFAYSFIEDAVQRKKELLHSPESLLREPDRSQIIETYRPSWLPYPLNVANDSHRRV